MTRSLIESIRNYQKKTRDAGKVDNKEKEEHQKQIWKEEEIEGSRIEEWNEENEMSNRTHMMNYEVLRTRIFKREILL